MKRSLIALAAVAALISCGGGGGGADAPAPQALGVELYSDSIGAGYGVRVPPAARMQQLRPAWQVVDHSVNGLQLTALMQGFAGLHRTGRYVPLALGLNDAYLGALGYEQSLRTAIEQLQREGRVPVLTGVVGVPRPPALAVRHNAITHALAREYGLQHAGWGEDYRGEVDVIADGIHRTQEASDRLAALLVAAIERAAQEEQQR